MHLARLLVLLLILSGMSRREGAAPVDARRRDPAAPSADGAPTRPRGGAGVRRRRLLLLDDRDSRRQATVAVGRWACRVTVRPRRRVGDARSTASSSASGRGPGASEARRSARARSTSCSLTARSGRRATTTRRSHAWIHEPEGSRACTSMARIQQGLATCGGRVWVGHGREVAWQTSIHPGTHRMRRVNVGSAAPGWPECIRGAIWVTTPNSVDRIDPGDESGGLPAAPRRDARACRRRPG